MSEPQFPVDLVSPDGAAWQANTNAELVQLVYGEGYRLRRAAPGVEGVGIAAPQRRSVLSTTPPPSVRGGSPIEPSEPDEEPAAAEPSPPPAPRPRPRTTRKGKA